MAKRKGFGGFPGGLGGANMNQLMQQAQRMQRDMEAARAKIDELEMEATAGGGMVKVKMNGKNRLLSVTIDPEALDPDDLEMLQDTICSAVNEAQRLLAEEAEKLMPNMGAMGGGLF